MENNVSVYDVENDSVDCYTFICSHAYYGFKCPTEEYITELADICEEAEVDEDYVEKLRNMDQETI